jgi:hypothetical protein
MSKILHKKSIKNRLCQHYQQVGISPKQAARYSSLVDKWLTKSGPEWTVKRLKSLDASFKSHLSDDSGSHYQVPEFVKSRRNRKGARIFDDGLLHYMFQDLDNPKKLKLAQAFFRSHQVIVAKRPTKAMVDDFKASVQTGFVEGGGDYSALEQAKELVKMSFKGLRDAREDFDDTYVNNIVPLASWPAQSEKRSPVYRMGLTSAGGPDVVLRPENRTNVKTKSFIELFWNDHVMRSIWERYPEKVSKLITGTTTMPCPDFGKYSYHPGYLKGGKLLAGSIGFIMEGGWKNRAVASPFLAYQALAEPLKQKLFHVSRLDNLVYTEDQSKAHEKIVSWLRDPNVGTVYSYDASAFTDRFPYALQYETLVSLNEKGYVSKFDIEVINKIVDSRWKLPDSKETVKYEVGQPMGLGPSFHLACLTHAAIVRGICRSHGISNPSDHACIVGDDVVISHPVVAKEYYSLMTGCGVRINLQKSLVSENYSEFCGKLISDFGVNPSMKTRLIENPDQLMRVLEFYGKKGLPYLNKNERRWAVHAFLPTSVGGLGWTPDGMTYKEYLSYLNIDKLQDKVLRDQLTEFLEPVTGVTRQNEMSWVQEFYSCNLMSHAYYRKWCTDNGYDGKTSDLTGLPVSSVSSRIDDVVYPNLNSLNPRDENFKAIVRSLRSDLIDQIEKYGHINAVPVHTINRINQVLLDKYGYVKEIYKDFNIIDSLYMLNHKDMSEPANPGDDQTNNNQKVSQDEYELNSRKAERNVRRYVISSESDESGNTKARSFASSQSVNKDVFASILLEAAKAETEKREREKAAKEKRERQRKKRGGEPQP